MFAKKLFNHQIFLILFIFVLALCLRLYGLNWDQGQHLHPDERFLTMVSSDIKLPSGINQYFDTTNSPLNPYNYKDYHFFVYGTFPLFLIKFFSEFLNLADYNHVHLVGRVFSGIFDSLNIFLLYFLSLIILKNKKNSFFIFLPSLVYCFAVLPVQLSHFFAVDTFLTFFILLSFVSFSYWLQKKYFRYLFFGSVSFGLAMSCKVSAILFFPVIFLFFIFRFLKNKKQALFDFLIFSLISFVTFRIFQPYAFLGWFQINPDFIKSLVSLKSILINKDVFYPPEIQWLNRTLIIYPFLNIFFWGLGIPVFLFFILSFKNFFKINLKIFFKKILNKPKIFIIFCAVFWTLFLFIEQGTQFTHTMRYFLPIYPFICFLAVFVASNKINLKIIFLIIFFHILYGSLFLSIYSHSHSRVQASEWIYKNIPSNSKITNEYWDDPLPLNLSGFNFSFQNEMLSLYDPDTPEKWNHINSILKNTDYVFMSSNRLWGSIPRVPNRYPTTSKFYQDLFDEKLSFKKMAEFNSYPGISLSFLNKCFYFGPTNFPYKTKKNQWFQVDNNCQYPGIYLRDDIAEEAFTVYDHPKVLIYQSDKIK